MNTKFARTIAAVMEPLFSADIIVNGENKLYNIFFHDEQYHFEPEDGQGQAFHVWREDDEWKTNGSLAEIAQQQALSALDIYLLSQH